jgi:hypothetical protein
VHFQYLRGEAHHHEGCSVFKRSLVGKKVQLYGGRSVRLESKEMVLMSKEGFDRSFKIFRETRLKFPFQATMPGKGFGGVTIAANLRQSGNFNQDTSCIVCEVREEKHNTGCDLF